MALRRKQTRNKGLLLKNYNVEENCQRSRRRFPEKEIVENTLVAI